MLILWVGRSHVSHWVAGTRPSGRGPALLAETLSRTLGRRITPRDIGLGDVVSGRGGTVVAENSTSSGNTQFGYLASLGGSIDALRASSTDNGAGATGFAAAHGGFLRCTNGSSTAPTGLIVNDGGVALCDVAALTQNVRVQGTAHANLNAITGNAQATVSANSTLVFPRANGTCSPTADSFCILTP